MSSHLQIASIECNFYRETSRNPGIRKSKQQSSLSSIKIPSPNIFLQENRRCIRISKRRNIALQRVQSVRQKLYDHLQNRQIQPSRATCTEKVQ